MNLLSIVFDNLVATDKSKESHSTEMPYFTESMYQSSVQHNTPICANCVKLLLLFLRLS
jgi:hypothetical protein